MNEPYDPSAYHETDATKDEQFELTSVGIDIGSATSHLAISRLVMRKAGNRYLVSERDLVFESPILLTPYVEGMLIDGARLERFIEEQYRAAGITRDVIDTGAVLLTGVALLRENSRLVAEVFAADAGKFVAVSAGDSLEGILAAHGAGAVALSAERGLRLVNIDVGGGTTKLTLCEGGRALQVTTLDVGARLVATDADGRVVRLEESARRIAAALGIELELGAVPPAGALDLIVAHMADEVMSAVPLGQPTGSSPLLRNPALPADPPATAVTLSGGISEYVYGRESRGFGDLGQLLAAALSERLHRDCVETLPQRSGIRATVLGASQYTAQVSGSTICVVPPDAVPARNVPVVQPAFPLDAVVVNEVAVADALEEALIRSDLTNRVGPVAIGLRWAGPATWARLDALAKGILRGIASGAARTDDDPIVLVCDDDVGGLVGTHMIAELSVRQPLISIDCVTVNDFDYIDIGHRVTGQAVVPVVIKSLVFPQVAAHA